MSTPLVELSISLGGSPLGPLTLQLHPSTPLTNENFLHHCAHSYAGTRFHRVIRGFMVQGGDFQRGDGTGGESKWGGKFADEKLGVIPHDRAGVLSMANGGPGTNGSQFFVTLGKCRHLDGKHVAFGEVVGGFDVLERMGGVETEGRDRPILMETLKIESARVLGEEGGGGKSPGKRKASDAGDEDSSSDESRGRKKSKKSKKEKKHKKEKKKKSKKEKRHKKKKKRRDSDDSDSSSSSDSDTRRNPITGAKVRMHVDKDDDDRAKEAGRKELLAFMNSQF
ncbi:hypothetical protein TeGR_g21 [Tetraparma gracilis]|uniref:Peptidyl-prolyl cis-trans isomerase n=1 Tax=Tetraparma gracilis TaxID=2962635 RepID=A0ABQ6N1L0_9STRA|nr:hypothetical protein TeGR_g21 [Tetraparma gracilis]